MPGCRRPGSGGAGARQLWVASSDAARARVSATVVHASRTTETEILDTQSGLTDEQKAAINNGNAKRILKRLA